MPCNTFFAFPENRLEALAVNDTRAGLVVLLLRAPEVLEGRERRENRSTDPDGVLPLGRSNNLDLIAVRHTDQRSIHILRDKLEIDIPSYLRAQAQ